MNAATNVDSELTLNFSPKALSDLIGGGSELADRSANRTEVLDQIQKGDDLDIGITQATWGDEEANLEPRLFYARLFARLDHDWEHGEACAPVESSSLLLGVAGGVQGCS